MIKEYQVTDQDIDESGSCTNNCAIARCLQREYGGYTYVTSEEIFNTQFRSYKVSPVLNVWIKQYDRWWRTRQALTCPRPERIKIFMNPDTKVFGIAPSSI